MNIINNNENYQNSTEQVLSFSILEVIKNIQSNNVNYLEFRNAILDRRVDGKVAILEKDFSDMASKIINEPSVIDAFNERLANSPDTMYKIPRNDGSFSNGVIVCGFKGGDCQTMFYDENTQTIRLKTFSADTIGNIIDLWISDMKLKNQTNDRIITAELYKNKVQIALISKEDNLQVLLDFLKSHDVDKLNNILNYAQDKTAQTATELIEGYNVINSVILSTKNEQV